MLDDIYSGTIPTLSVGTDYVLREQADKDAGPYFNYMKDGTVGQYILAPDPRTKVEALSEVRYCRNLFRSKRGFYWTLAKKDTDEMIGAVGLYTNNFHHRAELCYDLSADYHRQGIMSEAIIAVLEFCFRQANFQRIEAVTMCDNAASSGILLKMGFDFEGVLKKYRYYEGKFYDINMYAMSRDSFMANPPKGQASSLDNILDDLSSGNN